MTLSPIQRLLWGAIASCEGIGAGTIRRLLEQKATAEDVWYGSRELYARAGLSELLQQRLHTWRLRFNLEKFEEQLVTEGIRIVVRGDEEYPIPLTTIFDPPEVLFVRGTLPPAVPCIAVVGTRAPTEYGTQVLERLLAPVVDQGVPVISGLAWGTDGNAHALALAHKAYTCAVLGSGVDAETIYPAHNKGLAKQILEQGGGILSESPPGRKPRPESFPVRNRIIAGMVQAVVVVEAATDSGTLITATAALEAGREVLAVPGSIWSDKSAGTHQLIRCGARLCADSRDIFDALHLDRVETCTQAQLDLPLSGDERALYEQLAAPQTADELTRLIDWSIGRINQALSMLELKQLVVRLPNQTWGRS